MICCISEVDVVPSDYGDAVNFTFVLKFKMVYSPELKDRSSNRYKTTSSLSKRILKNIIDETTVAVADYSSLQWNYEEGSVIASVNVPLLNVISEKDVQQQIANVNTSRTPYLIAINVKKSGCQSQYHFVLNYVVHKLEISI